MRKLSYDETKLKNLPPGQRGKQTDQYLTRYGIDGKNLSPEEKLALIRDELDKRHRRSRWYVIATTITFVVCFAIAAVSFWPRTGTAEDRNAYLDTNGTIIQPRESAVVNATFNASGTADHVGQGVYLWLAVEIDGRIWPKEAHVTVDQNGQWNQSVFEDGHPDQFELSLWAANADANDRLRAWLINGQQTGVYPELRPFSGMKRLWRVEKLRIAK
ncbi:MAG TPA: hypothetical protein VN696_15605 [Pyrinomonadaceae bacterium]|nr:hypothetical protein [Pyrinomonadaceae bacterium]